MLKKSYSGIFYRAQREKESLDIACLICYCGFKERIDMKPFEYLEPKTIEEATSLLSHYGNKARILAGGMDLIPRMQKGEIEPEYVVNIQNIPTLERLEPCDQGGISFGAMAKLRSIEFSRRQ